MFKKKSSNEIRYVQKFRGISLNWTALEAMGREISDEPAGDEQQLRQNSYEAIKGRILDWANFGITENWSQMSIDEEMRLEGPLRIGFRQIRCDKMGTVRTISTSKKYEPIITNAVVTKEFNVIPFGYNGSL